MSKIKLVAVVGPTASGKTDLAVMIAEKFNGEVVSFDSMQIYDFAPIATAMPTDDEMKGIPHHMLGIAKQGENFSVSQYTEAASSIIQDISDRGKLPVLVGGTGFYYSALIDNIKFLPEGFNKKVRQDLLSRVESEGLKTLYDELLRIDPKSAERINPNDQKRILRGLEVYYSTGKTLTYQRNKSRMEPSVYDPCVIGLNFRDRQKLYNRINLRVDRMMENGLLEEAERVISCDRGGTGMQAIGIKELKPYFNGQTTLCDATEKIKQETRRYAKRQLTWFRRDERINWIFLDELCRENILKYAENIMEKYGIV